MNLDGSLRGRPTCGDAIAELIGSFVSLGNNCEFGLAQRYCGAEPIGLFRFSRTDLASLIDALDSDFEHYGSPGDLEILGNPNGLPSCRSRRHGFISYTSKIEDADQLLRRETDKIDRLKGRLLDELSTDDRVFVWKGDPAESVDDARRLARSLRRHSRCVLLHVRAAADRGVTIQDAGDGLICATLPRLAPVETAFDLDLEAWIALCVAVRRLLDGSETPGPPPRGRRNHLSMPWRRGGRHVLAGSEPFEVFGDYRRAGGLRSGTIHAYSAWVWIPRSFEGSRIAAAIGGGRLGWRDADLLLRETWQRVWVADRLPQTFRMLMMGLVARGPAGAQIWSGGHRLEEGPIPGPATPPRWTPRTG